MLTAADAVHASILAKDGNRPFLMQQAFAHNAELQIVLNTDAVAFPAETKGRRASVDRALAHILVSFGLGDLGTYLHQAEAVLPEP